MRPCWLPLHACCSCRRASTSGTKTRTWLRSTWMPSTSRCARGCLQHGRIQTCDRNEGMCVCARSHGAFGVLHVMAGSQLRDTALTTAWHCAPARLTCRPPLRSPVALPCSCSKHMWAWRLRWRPTGASSSLRQAGVGHGLGAAPAAIRSVSSSACSGCPQSRPLILRLLCTSSAGCFAAQVLLPPHLFSAK